ncbi:MAG: DUF2490 domain-containing protein [Gammaproteobacteria bacterium]
MPLRTGRLVTKFPKLLFLLASMSLTQNGLADELVEDSGLWTQIDGIVNLDSIDPKLDRFLLAATGEARFFDDFNHLSQGIIRLMPGFRFNENITLLFGYTWNPNDRINGRNFHEHDINQAFIWSLNPDWGQLKTRTMVEWRFVSNDSQLAVRLRQRIRAKYRLDALDRRLSLVGSEEIFFNANTVDWGPEGGFDQNRAFAGFDWQIDDKGHFTLELGYLNQYIYQPNRSDRLNHMLFTGILFNF